jgi:hypothetical protein
MSRLVWAMCPLRSCAMTKAPWDVGPPDIGDKSESITFQAVGAALNRWEWFEVELSLVFSFLIGAGGYLAWSRRYD